MNEKGMEMPIQVMIVLFLALAVAMLVLMFSQQLLFSAEEQLKINLDDVPKEQLIELKETNNTQIASLIESCYNTHNQKVFNNQTCFILILEQEFLLNEIQIKDLVFDGGIVGDLKNVGSKFFVIKWDFDLGKVEVE